MTVRGGKNRVLIYTGAGLLLVALVVFYHNAASKIEEARNKFEKCHLNEGSQSAQLQVLLEYKSRLEKSLQQEKSDHAQTKEDSKSKADEERQTRERENLESINKFTALQQQYKLLQGQHEDVTQELDKAKQELLTAEERKASQDKQVAGLTRQIKLLNDGKESDVTLLQSKISKLETDYEALKKDNNSTQLRREVVDLQRELRECLGESPLSVIKKKTDEESQAEDTLGAPALQRRSAVQSSTAANRVEIVSGAAVYINTSTPLINPDAVQSQDGGQIKTRKGVLPEYNQVAAPIAEIQRIQIRPQMAAVVPPGNEAAHPMFAYDEHEMEHRKEEEDDDVDQLDYQADKGPDPAQAPPARQIYAQAHDGIMLNPK